MCVTEPRRGGRAGPASGSHSQQDLWWRPGQGWAAGGRPGQLTAEQRSQGDPDGGQAAQRRQIILLGWGAGLRSCPGPGVQESVAALCQVKTWIPFLYYTFDVAWEKERWLSVVPGELSQQQINYWGFQTLLGPKLCSVWYNAAKLIIIISFTHRSLEHSWSWFQPVLTYSTSWDHLLSHVETALLG